MSAFDRFRTVDGGQGGDLASFFRSLVTPTRRYGVSSACASSDYDWEQLRAQGGQRLNGGAKQLDFFDHGLSGTQGADVVLKALVENPGATSISLSQNNLGDNGVRALLVGMKQLRAKAIGGRLQELNLSGNSLTDVSLHLIALHLLQPSPHPPTLTHLYLTANKLSLSSSELTAFLGAALSSPASALRCLSLTNNMSIGSAGLLSLLSHLKLGASSQLAQLHFSLCNLTPDCIAPLAEWLKDPLGGSRLQVLGINGNRVSEAGLRRIAQSVLSGKASSLIHLECHANDEAGEEWQGVISELETTKDDGDWREKLEVIKERNKTVLKETRLAALGLLAKGRVMFGGDPHEPPVDVGAIRRGVEDLDVRQDTYSASQRSPLSTSYFPFLHLPIELQVHILRCSLLVTPSLVAHLYPPLDNCEVAPTTPSALSSPLTEHQFLNLLAHCASSTTLQSEIRIGKAGGRIPSLGQAHGWQQESWVETGSSSTATGWEEWVLRTTECDRFARA